MRSFVHAMRDLPAARRGIIPGRKQPASQQVLRTRDVTEGRRVAEQRADRQKLSGRLPDPPACEEISTRA